MNTKHKNDNRPVSFRMPEYMLESVDKIANQMGVNRSKALRTFVKFCVFTENVLSGEEVKTRKE